MSAFLRVVSNQLNVLVINECTLYLPNLNGASRDLGPQVVFLTTELKLNSQVHSLELMKSDFLYPHCWGMERWGEEERERGREANNFNIFYSLVPSGGGSRKVN